MFTLPGINGELAAAIRRVNALRSSLPDEHRPIFDLARWRRLEAELRRACTTGDHDCALAAIDRWERQAASTLSPASQVLHESTTERTR